MRSGRGQRAYLAAYRAGMRILDPFRIFEDGLESGDTSAWSSAEP